MWVTGLNASGAGTPTHYISNGKIQSNFAVLLPLAEPDADGVYVRTSQGQADAIYAAAQAAGSTVTLAQIQALLAAADISAQEPFAAMARLNLQMTRETL